MEYTITLGVWAVSVAAPCVISWLAGDMVGSARARRLYQPEGPLGRDPVNGEPLYAQTFGADDLVVDSWRLGPSPRAHAQSGAKAATAAPVRPAFADRRARGSLLSELRDEISFEEQALAAEQRRERREALAAQSAPANAALADDVPAYTVVSDCEARAEPILRAVPNPRDTRLHYAGIAPRDW